MLALGVSTNWPNLLKTVIFMGVLHLEAEVGIELGKPAQLLPNPSPKPFGSRNFSSKLLYENPANNTLVNQANNANKLLTHANNLQLRWCPFWCPCSIGEVFHVCALEMLF